MGFKKPNETVDSSQRTFHVKGDAYIAGLGQWRVVEEDVQAITSQMAIAMVGSNYAAFRPIECTELQK